MKFFRHYGRSYIYDKLHRGIVTTLIALTGLTIIQIGVIITPALKRHMQNSLSPSKEGNAAGTENKNSN